mmetsp:Transcript_403/g.473  ORF Transcript_403/g.473 Transcript_403/m.473 type:complete len:238 (+) Transcript_403:71-784(+)|eukprot:CAMPEP_0194165210 /NCGR_PEP_ID=MMETSP0154-20130528/1203_1 /TAXON_ID=1049557 /ORGANISM="Thalassiothrix antarctica, Strain L6-D1" /LENGTH=237 /DNA_ID=CAMNT_0038875591 /DNA_START=70 /DNA_END=783 /DNA_ORIENTATION=+
MSSVEEMPEYQLTTGIVKYFEDIRINFDKYIKYQKTEIDGQVMDYKLKMKKEQLQINYLIDDLYGVQSERGLSNNIGGIAQHHRDINLRRRQFEERLEELSRNYEEKEKIIRELQDFELHYRDKAEKARERKVKIQEAKTTTIEDLTKGIVNYNYLGFTFIKVSNGLRFTFTKIDKEDSGKEFSFTLVANDYDTYEILDCELDNELVRGLLNHLNDTDDLSFFVLQIRRAFLDTLKN